MGYVALRPFASRVAHRQVGDAVPEASEWRHIHTWINQGWVTLVPDGKEAAFKELLGTGVLPDPELAPLAKRHHLQFAVGRASQAAVKCSQNVSPETVEHATPIPEVKAGRFAKPYKRLPRLDA